VAAELGDVDVQYVWRFLRAQKIDLAGANPGARAAIRSSPPRRPTWLGSDSGRLNIPRICSESWTLLFLRAPARLSQSYPRAPAIFVDELDPGGFQGVPQRGFISEGCRNFSINNFNAPDRRAKTA
jgi:hypothetical protein